MDKFVKKRSEPSTSSESVGKKTRLYNENYLNYGFTLLDGKPQCVACSQILSDESMKPSKLVGHLETKHPAYKNKPLEFFERKLYTLRNQQTSILPDHAIGQCLFDVFYEATRNYTNIDWTKCIAVCSDGARAITGKNSGLMKILRDRLIPRAEWTHCFLHRHALVTKNMPENLNQILCEAVKLVNFIKSRPLQNRLFAKLCDEMDENKKSLLFHTEVRWLLRRKVLTRVLELRDELIFFQDKQTPFSLFLQNNECMLLLAKLADVFSHLNDLNVNLQERDKNILLMTDKVHAFIKKFDIWTKLLL
ncbi:zinc finger BED domain-containing protein 5-like [Centruroides vittatus]|uniref:zinc finger BED domain-containing protein 5-like n=1 Tax=Centruroides vittatus TaxID=120091 RepID=UPI00350F1DF7